MSVQQFCLRWNNHQPNFISVCSSLLHNGTLVDVTLAAEGRQLQAHKIVLSACSSYFQTLFTTNPCQHPIVILKDVQYDDLKTMVDFMYYGEVNVSQEQLPHILKTAEMLKIKGLAEMPTDPANLTKSDSKSSNEATELVGSGGNSQSGGGLSSTGGSVSDSLWGSTESQFQQQQQQQQQHHHHQQQQIQQQQQQQHHHHHQQPLHHQQQQSSQTQTTQHHQLRRTPSPLGAGASPATRRKRLRKSSNNGSGDRNNSEDQHNSSIDPNNQAGGISLSQMSQMSFGTGGNAGSLSGITGHSLHSTKLLKEPSSSELEPHPQDSDSLDDGQGHVHMHIKPEVDIGGVQQTMPLELSGATTPSEHDAPNSQSSHSDSTSSKITVYASRALSRDIHITTTSSIENIDLDQHQQQQMGTKRNRVLTRQPRVKRDSDSLSNNQVSPDPLAINVDYEPFNTSSVVTTTSNATPTTYQISHLHHHPHLLTVLPRMERHSSEPAPSLTPTSPHLLSVPQTTPFLIKQYSDPLLPSHHHLHQHHHHHSGISSTNSAISGGSTSSNPFSTLHRQYSHPLPSNSSNSSNISHITTAPLHHSHHISLPESIYENASPPPAGSSSYIVPQKINSSTQSGNFSDASASTSIPATSATTISSTTSYKKTLSMPQFSTTTTFVGDSDRSSNSPKMLTVGERTPSETEKHSHTSNTKLRTPTKSTSAVVLGDRSSSQPSNTTLQSTSFDNLTTLRVKSEELQRSVSSPQTAREIITLENPRSSHCPVIRPGPALGCNFCWNTIDGHGRILRRKTKYHCPECQTNLCIVPCFQEYHERLNSDAASTSNTSSNDKSKHFSSATGVSGSNVARHYNKTETI